jgi:hypothetical protein
MAKRRMGRRVRLVLHLPADVHRLLRRLAARADTTTAAYVETLLKQRVLDGEPVSDRAEPVAGAATPRSWLATLAAATGVAEVRPLGDPLAPTRVALERSRAFEADGRRALARLAEVATEAPRTARASPARPPGHEPRELAPSWGVWVSNETVDEVADLEARFLVESPAPRAPTLRAMHGDAIDSFPLAWPASRDLSHRLFLLDHLHEIAHRLRKTVLVARRMVAECLEQHVTGSDLSPRVLLEATRPQLVRNQRRPLNLLRALVIDMMVAFDDWLEWLELLETLPLQVRGRQKGGRRRKVPEPLRFAAYETASRLMRLHPRRSQKPTDSAIVADTHTMLTTRGGWDPQKITVSNVRDAIKREHARRLSERATPA